MQDNYPPSALDRAAKAMAGPREWPEIGPDIGADASGAASSEALQFYHIFAETPLLLLLQTEAQSSDLLPHLFDLPSGRMVLAFDSEERLGAWAASMGQGALPFAALPGRVLAGLIAAQEGLSLGLNFGAGSASEMVLPPESMAWLVQMLNVAPAAQMAQITHILPLGDVPSAMMAALARGMTGAGALAQRAILARAAYNSGAQAHIVAFFGVASAAEAPLARAVAEALAFSGLEAAALDVIFPADGPSARAILAQGVEIDLPKPIAADPIKPRSAPGMDKDRPPKLR